jgi:hypothetical protein
MEVTKFHQIVCEVALGGELGCRRQMIQKRYFIHLRSEKPLIPASTPEISEFNCRLAITVQFVL